MFPNPALILTEFVALFCHSSQDDQDGCGTAVAVRDLMPFFFQGGGGGDDDMGDEAVVIHAFEKLQQQHRNKNIVSIDDNGFAWIDASEVIQAVNQDLEKTVYIEGLPKKWDRDTLMNQFNSNLIQHLYIPSPCMFPRHAHQHQNNKKQLNGSAVHASPIENTSFSTSSSKFAFITFKTVQDAHNVLKECSSHVHLCSDNLHSLLKHHQSHTATPSSISSQDPSTNSSSPSRNNTYQGLRVMAKTEWLAKTREYKALHAKMNGVLRSSRSRNSTNTRVGTGIIPVQITSTVSTSNTTEFQTGTLARFINVHPHSSTRILKRLFNSLSSSSSVSSTSSTYPSSSTTTSSTFSSSSSVIFIQHEYGTTHGLIHFKSPLDASSVKFYLDRIELFQQDRNCSGILYNSIDQQQQLQKLDRRFVKLELLSGREERRAWSRLQKFQQGLEQEQQHQQHQQQLQQPLLPPSTSTSSTVASNSKIVSNSAHVRFDSSGDEEEEEEEKEVEEGGLKRPDSSEDNPQLSKKRKE